VVHRTACFLLFSAFLFGQNPAPANKIGFYHWGGEYPSSITRGVEEIARLKGHIARITLSARYLIDYHRSYTCSEKFSLDNALREDSDLQTALATPGIDVVMITALDGVSYSDCATSNALSPAFYTPENTAALNREYSEFVFLLCQMFQGSGKRFIISNWESDSWIYCGSISGYAEDPVFRRSCDDAYPASYSGNRNVSDSLSGITRWMQTRWAGVEEGRARARNAGFLNVDVSLAVEIASVHYLHDRGFKSVLYDVIPSVPYDSISFSAYECQNGADLNVILRETLDTIKAIGGNAPIIIGEIGFDRVAFGETAIPKIVEFDAAAIQWGVLYVIHWNLFDQADYSFGLFDRRGEVTSYGKYYKDLFGVSLRK
jgi:hypothetical protein